MLQIDHIYEFLHKTLFNYTFDIYYPSTGIAYLKDNVTIRDFTIFNKKTNRYKIFFNDQEPIDQQILHVYIQCFKFPSGQNMNELIPKMKAGLTPYGIDLNCMSENECNLMISDPNWICKEPHIFVTSELSNDVQSIATQFNLKSLYYFFHGFAALDWYRGFYALNYTKQVQQDYQYDYVTFNRLIANDRSYRCYFVSLLHQHNLADKGQISFGLDNEHNGWQDEIKDPNTKLSPKAIANCIEYLPKNALTIDSATIHGSASADIPRCIDKSFWHIVTETVFYYEKLHLTEKIFKPIVTKQPFMLIGAKGNLAYLKSYGFKTFEGIIDESYDTIEDNDARVEAVVAQLKWYCSLPPDEKQRVIDAITPIVEFNFYHFYGDFGRILTEELITNTKTLFADINYDDSAVNYDALRKVLTN